MNNEGWGHFNDTKMQIPFDYQVIQKMEEGSRQISCCKSYLLDFTLLKALQRLIVVWFRLSWGKYSILVGKMRSAEEFKQIQRPTFSNRRKRFLTSKMNLWKWITVCSWPEFHCLLLPSQSSNYADTGSEIGPKIHIRWTSIHCHILGITCPKKYAVVKKIDAFKFWITSFANLFC